MKKFLGLAAITLILTSCATLSSWNKPTFESVKDTYRDTIVNYLTSIGAPREISINIGICIADAHAKILDEAGCAVDVDKEFAVNAEICSSNKPELPIAAFVATQDCVVKFTNDDPAMQE